MTRRVGRPKGRATRANRPRGLTLEGVFRWHMPGEPPPEGRLWAWSGIVDQDGYGIVNHEGRRYRAHRVAYMIFRGPIPQGLIVRHRYDTPVDVNPWNLELGTHADNARDRRERGTTEIGRMALEARPTLPPLAEPPKRYEKKGYPDSRPDIAGAANGRSKLTDEIVLEIRARHATGESMTSLGKEFGISTQTISNVVKRNNWTHI